MLKVIETIYNDYRFRSRVEARWAVFFDTLGIRYEYEKEGYDLDGVWYLPDFWLPKQKCWVEIKGEFNYGDTCVEVVKAERLAQATGKGVFIFAGSDFSAPIFFPISGMWAYEFIPNGKGGWSEHCRGVEGYAWVDCPICREVRIDFGGHCTQCVMSDKDRQDWSGTPRLLAAYRAARQARFGYDHANE